MRSAERVERCYARMLEDYGAHSLVKTRAYEGVPVLVRALRADGVQLAVHSNKADSPTQTIVAALLDPDDFVAVRGRGRTRRSSLTRQWRWASPAGSGCRRRVWSTSATRWWTCAPARRRACCPSAPPGASARRRSSWRAARPWSSTLHSTCSRCAEAAYSVASAPASVSSSRNAGMSVGCAATTAGPRPCAAARCSTAAPASRAMSVPAA